jgi:hypothetical protein
VRNSRILVASFGLVSSVFALSCGSKEPAAPACPTFDYSKYMPASTTLTLTKDLATIVQTSCATATTCHGNTATVMAANEPHFGPIGPGAATMADLQAIHDAIVGKASAELPSMPYVTAGDPDNSWVMKKIEGVNGCGGFVCTAGVPKAKTPCGDPMPQAPSPELEPADISKFRDWIKGGAKL